MREYPQFVRIYFQRDSVLVKVNKVLPILPRFPLPVVSLVTGSVAKYSQWELPFGRINVVLNMLFRKFVRS